MRIGILSFRPSSLALTYEEKALERVAKERGHEVQVFRSAHCQLVYDDQGERVFWNGKVFPKIDVLIPRPRVLSDADLRVSIVKQFEMMGVPVLNSYESITRAKNKLRTQQILHSLGIPTPQTVVIEGYLALNMAIDRLGGAPVILKDPFGTYGSGVVIAESKRAARSFLDALWVSGGAKIVMVQEYIAESEGKDTRVFVVGNKVVAAMERSAQAEEFRSNVELGGKTKAVTIDKEYEKIALQSAKALGLDVAGVDIIQTRRGPAVLEVNSNPGFKALEKVYQEREGGGPGLVAGAIIDWALQKINGSTK